MFSFKGWWILVLLLALFGGFFVYLKFFRTKGQDKPGYDAMEQIPHYLGYRKLEQSQLDDFTEDDCSYTSDELTTYHKEHPLPKEKMAQSPRSRSSPCPKDGIAYEENTRPDFPGKSAQKRGEESKDSGTDCRESEPESETDLEEGDLNEKTLDPKFPEDAELQEALDFNEEKPVHPRRLEVQKKGKFC
ncbi:MAG: hypothetical protein ACYCOU_16505 [Sulfobacillus sp.]